VAQIGTLFEKPFNGHNCSSQENARANSRPSVAGESLVGLTATDAAMLLPRAASYNGYRSSLFGHESGKALPSAKSYGQKAKKYLNYMAPGRSFSPPRYIPALSFPLIRVPGGLRWQIDASRRL
jgi:hypothetical protein